jgi:hypothetical protein
VRTRLDQFEIKKNVPQNKPIAVLTKRVFHEFRNKTDRPRATSVRPLIRMRRSGDPESVESLVWTSFIDLLLFDLIGGMDALSPRSVNHFGVLCGVPTGQSNNYSS